MNALTRTILGGPAGPWATEIALLVLRVSLGLYIALGHGLGKLPPSEQFIGMTEGLGFTAAPTFFAWAAALTEFAGGLLLALGLLTRPTALGLVFNMGVAAYVAHGPDPYVAKPGDPSKEAAMLYLIPFLAFAVIGAGRTGLDTVLRRALTTRRDRRSAAVA